MWFPIFFFLAYLPALVFPQAATDEIQDADPAQSGYLYVYHKTLLYYNGL
jgi:iron transport multicopper oxidase